jgi:hypothetical protein
LFRRCCFYKQNDGQTGRKAKRTVSDTCCFGRSDPACRQIKDVDRILSRANACALSLSVIPPPLGTQMRAIDEKPCMRYIAQTIEVTISASMNR